MSDNQCHTHDHHDDCCSHVHHDSCCSTEFKCPCGCGCQEGKCSCQESGECKKGSFAKELLEMADDAWMEVLHEKIKEKIIATNGGQLDKLASLVTETNNARWKNKMSQHRCCEDFKEKVKSILDTQ